MGGFNDGTTNFRPTLAGMDADAADGDASLYFGNGLLELFDYSGPLQSGLQILAGLY